MLSISKRYVATHALKKVSLAVNRGEVMALVGENGAGKSTLMKILSGAEQADEGQVLINGRAVAISSPRVAQSLGISMIYQELELAEHLSVAENILVGREPSTKLGFVAYDRLYKDSRRIMEDLHIQLDPREKVTRLSIASKQMVEIAKAVSMNANVVIMDEPTSSLPSVSTSGIDEVSILMELIDRLKSRGIAVIYVSHRLHEVFRVSDRIAVLRDGQLMAILSNKEATHAEVVRLMVGRELMDFYGKPTKRDIGPVAMNVDVLGENNSVVSSFSVRKGEILGIAGLIGAGRTELALAIFGYSHEYKVHIRMGDMSGSFVSPQEAVKARLGYVPEDRKLQGLFLNMAIRPNISSAVSKRISRFGLISRRRDNQLSAECMERLHIRAAGTEQLAKELSGGNQQKTVLARWLSANPKVLILDEPTRGIDVGAKAEIYTLMHQLTAQGIAIIMISSELPEILGMSDRILVMRQGKIVGSVDTDATEEKIMNLATGAEKTE